MERTAPLHTIAAALRRERERHGISLAELARRAGIAKSTLSQLEAGAGNPSVETLWVLAVTLDVPFSRLIDPPSAPVHVVRAADRPVLRSEHAPFTSALLAACPPGARRDLHLMTAEPGPVREAEAHIPGAVEHMIVTTGRWRAGPADAAVELGPGDYLRFAADQPHRYEALEPGSAAVLVMEYV
jgi:transcriptional regulator with XRE-family HTH domain